MVEYLIDSATLTAIADAIREKLDIETPILVSEFAEKILSIGEEET